MIRTAIVAATLALTGAAVAATPAKPAFEGAELASKTKVTLLQAEAIALKARAGKIDERELEDENGGLRYSFIIKVGEQEYEVGVDAQTGAVLENKLETDDDAD